MEKELKKRFLVTSLGVVFFVLMSMAIVMNVYNYLQVDTRAKEMTKLIDEGDGFLPKPDDRNTMGASGEAPYATRFFTVKLTKDNTIISANTQSVHLIQVSDAVRLSENIVKSSKTSGFVDQYKYQILDKEYGKLIVFIDCSQELYVFTTFLISSIVICLIALLFVGVIMVVLSEKAVQFMMKSYKKQQSFITNITHELKTPLAIIKTNTEVIEIESDETEWTKSIHHQVGRLNELVNFLVANAKLEEQTSEKTYFSMSDIINETITEFLVLAESKKMSIKNEVSDNIFYSGDEREIKIVISSLLENAIKYGTCGSEIVVNMRNQREKVKIEIKNESEGLEIKKYDEVFERFFRLEDSRNSDTGGFGIGLAMVKSVVTKHKGSVKAESKDGKTFKIEIIM